MDQDCTDHDGRLKMDGEGIPRGSSPAPTLRVVLNLKQAEWLDRYGAVRSPLSAVLGVPLFEANEYTDLLLECLRTSHPNQTRQRLLAKAHNARMRHYAKVAQAPVTQGIHKSIFVDPDKTKRPEKRPRIGDDDYAPDRSRWPWNPEGPKAALNWWDDGPLERDEDVPFWLDSEDDPCDDIELLLEEPIREPTLHWIDPYPSYQAKLDHPEVAIRAIWYLYCRERWDLLAQLGLDPEVDGDMLDACFPDDLALHVAVLGCGLKPGPVCPLGEDRLDVLYEKCPRFFGAARRLLSAYRARTYPTHHERKAGERRWQRFMSRLRDRLGPFYGPGGN